MRVVDIIADLRVDDVAAARQFYTDYLGLTTEEFNHGWVARYTSPESGESYWVLVAVDWIEMVVTEPES